MIALRTTNLVAHSSKLLKNQYIFPRLVKYYAIPSSQIPDSCSRIRERIWTVPNALTITRIFTSPVISYAIIQDHWGIALSLLAVSGATDALDGWLARRWQQQSALGSLLDPLGDKLLVGILAGSLFWKGLIPSWLLLIFISRDAILILVSGALRWKQLRSAFFELRPSEIIQPSLLSKVNTCLQIGTIAVGVAAGAGLLPNSMMDYQTALQYLAASTTILSGLGYIRPILQLVKKR